MTTGDAGGRRPTLRFRAVESELRGKPGDVVTFRLALFNGLRDTEVFEYYVEPLDEDFEYGLRAPTGPVATGQTVQIEAEVKIPHGSEPGEYTFRVAAVLRRDNTIGVAQDCIVTVGAPVLAAPLAAVPAKATSSSLPWVIGAIGVLAAGVALLFLLVGSGSSDPPPVVQGLSSTPTQSVRSSPTATAFAASTTPAPTLTATAGVISETNTPTVSATDSPSPAAGNTAPSVRIASPADGQLYCPKSNNQGVYTAEIPLQADVSDVEDGRLPNDQISWTFSLNGQEPQFFANSAIVGLELHVRATTFETVDVVVRATDSGGLSSQASIRLLVGGPASDACLNPATTPLSG